MTQSIRRNDPCPCGSGKRYKHCHGVHGENRAARITPPAANPDIDSLIRRGLASHQSGHIDSAVQIYQRILELQPENPFALHYLGVIDWQQERIERGEERIRRSIEARSDVADFHNNLGLLLHSQGRIEAEYRRLMAEGKSSLELGPALRSRELQLLQEARAAYEASLAVDPGYVEAHWGLAHIELLLGNVLRGWQEYEWRMRIPRQVQMITPDWGLPLWQGENLAGKTILLRTEQGAGDNILFIRYAQCLTNLGATVAVQCNDALAALLATAPGIARTEPLRSRPGPADFQVPVMSLPLRALEAKFFPPAQCPYLFADSARCAAWQQRLDQSGHSRIGVVWGGNPIVATDRYRSPGLAALLPLLQTPGVAWISLQKDKRSGDAELLARLPQLHDFTSYLVDFAETAALIETLDLVITSDTSVAHLAGALGKPVWILLCFCPDMRWGLAGDDSPWYPTARLFRQSVPGDWTGVVQHVANALRNILCVTG